MNVPHKFLWLQRPFYHKFLTSFFIGIAIKLLRVDIIEIPILPSYANIAIVTALLLFSLIHFLYLKKTEKANHTFSRGEGWFPFGYLVGAIITFIISPQDLNAKDVVLDLFIVFYFISILNIEFKERSIL